MNFQKYLDSTISSANNEKEILDSLHDKFNLGEITPLNQRAAERSLQILAENLIGKLKRILQYYNSPVIPNSGYDALDILHNVEAISDEETRFFKKVVGFRNALVHDYMDFNRAIITEIVLKQDYLKLWTFLLQVPEYTEVIRKRIENIVL